MKLKKQPNQFERTEKLLGKENLKSLYNKTILILGIGGVGGFIVESLVRSGIGSIIIVDNDVVDETNLNRQIIALNSTIGKKKVDILEKRIKDINENCNVVKIDKFITPDNIDLLFNYNIDYLVDACDFIDTKKSIIKECIKRNIKFISSMGTARKMDPSKLEITDIRKTYNDPLARILRKYIKEEKINKKIDVLSSTETPKKTEGLGSSIFVPASAGLLIGSYIIRKLID
ncbi:MAG: tRNA threonylcarbamoyladenosine dehydratase [Bacilli bacterium]|nr:tRNA threonylcarbamoyladenosine dehydratase [Bacilli bacterium]